MRSPSGRAFFVSYLQFVRMALIKTGPLVADINGSIGGTVFFQSAGGLAARAKSGQVAGRSTSKAQAQTRFSAAISMWRSLTTAQRGAWAALAGTGVFNRKNPFGDESKVSGYNAFVGINSLRMAAGMELIDIAPPSVLPGVPLSIKEQLTDATPSDFLVFVEGDLATHMGVKDRILVYATRPSSLSGIPLQNDKQVLIDVSESGDWTDEGSNVWSKPLNQSILKAFGPRTGGEAGFGLSIVFLKEQLGDDQNGFHRPVMPYVFDY